MGHGGHDYRWFVGRITRLTRSGLSIWNGEAGLPAPLTDAQWQIEFDAYKPSGI
jgi:cytochrome c oxidase assembly protein subunit 15